MRWTERSVIPTIKATSRILTSGSRAMQSRTWAWLERNVQGEAGSGAGRTGIPFALGPGLGSGLFRLMVFPFGFWVSFYRPNEGRPYRSDRAIGPKREIILYSFHENIFMIYMSHIGLPISSTTGGILELG